MEDKVSWTLLQTEYAKQADKIASLEQKIATAADDTHEIAGNTGDMNDTIDYRHELKLRDDSLRKELDLRQESFRAEQAVRDKALDDRFAGFFLAQSERDKAFEKVSDARFDRIEKDVASIKSDAKTVSLEVTAIRLVIARYVGGAIVIVAIASAALTAAAKYLFS